MGRALTEAASRWVQSFLARPIEHECKEPTAMVEGRDELALEPDRISARPISFHTSRNDDPAPWTSC